MRFPGIPVLFLALSCLCRAAEHPRLFFDKAELASLRQKIRQEPYATMVRKMIADQDQGDRGQPLDPSNPGYGESIIAQRSAFLYALSGDDKFARRAREMVEKRLADTKGWNNGGTKGLTLYWHGAKVAMAYDWCYGAPSWDKAFSDKVSKALLQQGQVILTRGGSEQNTNPASNWQGGRFASGGLCLLATDEPIDANQLNQAYGRVERFIKENLGPGGRGWNIEGLGYTYYPVGNFIHPFALAMQRRDPSRDLRKSTPAAPWSLWTVFAVQLTTTHLGRIRPDFGDDNPGTGLEGTGGQSFWWAPPELHPGLAWEYDRTVGARGDQSYDHLRGGTIWSVLHHPGNAVPPKDPLSLQAWRDGFVDLGGNGYMTYRSAYKDQTDSIAQIYLKFRGNKGHNGPDALSFRILGQDTAWAVGGGRWGEYAKAMNTVYPFEPGRTGKTSGESGQVVGTPVLLPTGDGHVVARIGTNNVGTGNHKRWFLSDFTRSGAAAAYVIGDTTSNGTHWQLCTYGKNKITHQGNTFLITTPQGATMQGTVLHPARPAFNVTQRKRGSNFGAETHNQAITVSGGDGNFLVVLTAVNGGTQHPAAQLAGTWGATPAAAVRVGGLNLRIEGDAIQR